MVAINLPIPEATNNSLNGSVVIVKDRKENMPAAAPLGFDIGRDYHFYHDAEQGNPGAEEAEGFNAPYLFFLDHYVEIPHFASLRKVSATTDHSQSSASISPTFQKYVIPSSQATKNSGPSKDLSSHQQHSAIIPTPLRIYI